MCRNIRTLFNFEPPATEEEIRASALQFVRKLSGFTNPSRANEAAFQRAVEEVTDAARRLRTHPAFPQFAQKVGLVRAWQTYGWPPQTQPLPGTDGSNMEFTCAWRSGSE